MLVYKESPCGLRYQTLRYQTVNRQCTSVSKADFIPYTAYVTSEIIELITITPFTLLLYHRHNKDLLEGSHVWE